MEDNILEVKDLKISFWTNNGTVKAVRDISFDLHRGETLAIVGESGSGKSVTSKAILGILAGNAIIEGGEILFDGKDLLKISEDDMYKIRGDKISMIFQDPLSSLDPIVKIGKQITEAMILKNKDSRKNARKEFNQKLACLGDNIVEAIGEEHKAEVSELCSTFDAFCIKANEIENSYNESANLSLEIIASVNDFLFLIERKQKVNAIQTLTGIENKLNKIVDPYFIHVYQNELSEHNVKLANIISAKKQNKEDQTLTEDEIQTLNELNAFLEKLTNQEKPNFFRIGYYMIKNPEAKLYEQNITEVNQMALEYLDNNFMKQFIEFEKKGIKNSHDKALEGKKAAVEYLTKLKEYFTKDVYDKKDTFLQIDGVEEIISKSIDKLDINKDSVAYTFPKAIKAAIKKLFINLKNNEKEERRFNRQTAKREALIAKGKTVDWKVVPMNIVSQETSVENITILIDRLINNYNYFISNASNVDFDDLGVKIIDHFKELASIVVYKITEAIAKEKAIKLMEEVGIPEPRIRYYQYPFEFSGGMRQRIVIAIALSANPDILICDEPTTALDVTIQSQILELINKLKKERNLSIIFITHDLGVVANMADRIAVMYAGKIVEYGDSKEIFYEPKHPYTWALLSSMPDLDTKEKLEAIPGTPPNMIYPPVGDAFAARNKYAMKIDFEMQPPLFKVSDTHYAATWLLHKDAPKVEMPKIIVDRIERMKQRDSEAEKAVKAEKPAKKAEEVKAESEVKEETVEVSTEEKVGANDGE